MEFKGNFDDHSRIFKEYPNTNPSRNYNEDEHLKVEDRVIFPDDVGTNFDDYSRGSAAFKNTNSRKHRNADEQSKMDGTNDGMSFDDHSRRPTAFTNTNSRGNGNEDYHLNVDDRIVFPDDSILTAGSMETYITEEKLETKFSSQQLSEEHKPEDDRIVFPDD